MIGENVLKLVLKQEPKKYQILLSETAILFMLQHHHLIAIMWDFADVHDVVYVNINIEYDDVIPILKL